MTQSKLYRDTQNRVVGGVASGLGRYFNIDPLLVRILFVLLAIFGGGGLIIYILLWIFVPDSYNNTIYSNSEGPGPAEKGEMRSPYEGKPGLDPGRGSLLAGLILIAIGGIFLVDRFIPHIYFEDLWPVILVIAGVALLFNHFRKEKSDKDEL